MTHTYSVKWKDLKFFHKPPSPVIRHPSFPSPHKAIVKLTINVYWPQRLQYVCTLSFPSLNFLNLILFYLVIYNSLIIHIIFYNCYY